MNILTQVFLPLALIIIMFTMGLGLSLKDFKQLVLKPKAFTLGLFCQFVTLPLFAYIVANILGLTNELAVGLMIISVCPGGVTSNVYAKLSDGDVALSIALTAVTSLISVLTIPFIINLSLTNFLKDSLVVELPILKTILVMTLVTSVPVALGMLLKSKRESSARRIEKALSRISILLFILIVLAAILKEKDNVIPYFKTAGTSTLLLNLFTMGFAYLISKLSRVPDSQVKTIVLECGIQNGTLAIMIAATFLQNETMTIPGAIYSLQMFITGGIVILLSKLSKRKKSYSIPHLQ